MSFPSPKCSWAVIYFVIFISSLAPAARAQGERCGVSKDFEVQALEQIKTGAAPEVEDGLQLLKHATEVCASFGDAWYYRSLFERKLGQVPKANYSLDKAKLFGSQAMDDGANPFVLAAPARPGETKLPPVRNKWALVVGISQFRDARLSLHYTTKDAKDFAAALVDPKVGRFPASNVHMLGESEVSTRRFKEELNWLARSAQEDDLVVIFVATHGTSRKDDTAEVNYIVTFDTDLASQDSLFGTALAMVELSDIVRTRIKARRTVILLDTCHSGGAMAASKERATGLADFAPSSEALDRLRQGVGRAILTSSQEEQFSYEGAPFQNGYFTHFLLEAIHQNNGMNTIQQDYDYVKDQLPKAVAARIQASRGVRLKNDSPAGGSQPATQVPALSSSELGGEIILGAPAATP
jgi:caspase domain-containing protein